MATTQDIREKHRLANVESSRQFFEDLAAKLPDHMRLADYQNYQSDHSRRIMIGGEQVGTLVRQSGSSWSGSMSDRYELTSPRIPSRASWRRGGSRQYSKPDSLLKAILKFCAATSGAETEREELERKIRTLQHRRDKSRDRASQILGSGGMHRAGHVVNNLVDPESDRIPVIERAMFWAKVYRKRFYPFMSAKLEPLERRSSELYKTICEEKSAREG